MFSIFTTLIFIAQASCDDKDWVFQQNFGTNIPADWIAFTGTVIMTQ
jgi:hypothetical protein